MSQQLLTRVKKTEVSQLVIKKLPMLVTFVLVGLCIHVVIQIAQMVLIEDKPTVTTTEVPVAVAMSTDDQRNFQQLINENIFGLASKKLPTVTKNVPETKLNLFLKGVFSSTPVARSTAIIARGKNGKEESYGVGDRLPGGVTIKEIQSDYVILERNNRLEILRMPKDESVGEIFSVFPDRDSQVQVGEGNAWDNIRRNISMNPQLLQEYAIPILVMENEVQVGYRLQPQQKGAMLAEIGLEPGDIVTSVNGVRLDSAKNDAKALKKLYNDKDINITIKRGGVEIPLSVNLQ